MNAAQDTTGASTTPGTETFRNPRPLAVRSALVGFVGRLGRPEFAREHALAPIRLVVKEALDASDVDTIGNFEWVLNTSLDYGYRGPFLMTFVYEVLRGRFAARVHRRLARSGRRLDSSEVEDLVGVTIEAVHNLVNKANREKHTLTYALLLSIADHRTIDYLRRKRPELNDNLDAYHTESAWAPEASRLSRPDEALWIQQRTQLARRLRTVVLDAVNELPEMERSALVLVEVFGEGYDSIADRLSIKRTDVGNLVRRARLRRDRLLMPKLRSISELDGHVGFHGLQANRSLRLNLLRWTTEMGDGVCACCARSTYRLHSADEGCFARANASSQSDAVRQAAMI